MMLDLVLVACLIADPGVCKPAKHIDVESMTPQQCLMHGQLQGALWIRTELGERYRIVKITCGRRTYEREA